MRNRLIYIVSPPNDPSAPLLIRFVRIDERVAVTEQERLKKVGLSTA